MPTRTTNDVIRRIKTVKGLIVSQRIDQWLLDHPEGVIADTPELQELLLRLTSDVSNSQREARFGASSRGTCLRQQVFRFLGMPVLRSMDSVLQNVFNDGTWRHIRWQLMGIAAGVLTDVEVKYTMPQYYLGTSLDGENSKEGWMFELKGMRYYGRVVEGDIPLGHMLQMHTTMLAGNFDRCIYIVEDKGSNDWKEVVIQRDPRIIKQVKDELNRASDSIEDEKLPPVLQDCKRRKGAEYRACPYHKWCPDQAKWPGKKKGRFVWGSTIRARGVNEQPGEVEG